MLVTTTVDVKHLIDRGALVVNPTFIPKTKEELIKKYGKDYPWLKNLNIEE